MKTSPRLPRNAGIAIGPILFVLALLGVIAAVMSTSSGGFDTAATADRVTSEIVNQANLIRGKINECNLRCVNAQALETSGGLACPEPWPDNYTVGSPPAAPTATVLAVRNIECPLDAGNPAGSTLWTAPQPTQLPPPTKGFESNPWNYVNAGPSGGRCIWTAPNSGNSSRAIVEGLTRAAGKFTTDELDYDPASSSQKFVVIITPATGTLDTNCQAP